MTLKRVRVTTWDEQNWARRCEAGARHQLWFVSLRLAKCPSHKAVAKHLMSVFDDAEILRTAVECRHDGAVFLQEVDRNELDMAYHVREHAKLTGPPREAFDSFIERLSVESKSADFYDASRPALVFHCLRYQEASLMDIVLRWQHAVCDLTPIMLALQRTFADAIQIRPAATTTKPTNPPARKPQPGLVATWLQFVRLVVLLVAIQVPRMFSVMLDAIRLRRFFVRAGIDGVVDPNRYDTDQADLRYTQLSLPAQVLRSIAHKIPIPSHWSNALLPVEPNGKRRTTATVNDVVLGILAGALRRYIVKTQPNDDEVCAGVIATSFALRTESRTECCLAINYNHQHNTRPVDPLMIDLALGPMTPDQRIQQASFESTRQKHDAISSFVADQLHRVANAIVGWSCTTTLLYRSPAPKDIEAARHPTIGTSNFGVVKQAMSIAGIACTSVMFGNGRDRCSAGLHCAIMSYGGTTTLSLCADRQIFSDLGLMADCVREQVAELQHILDLPV